MGTLIGKLSLGMRGREGMNSILAFSMSSKTRFYEKGDILFSDKGDVIGRVLKCLEVDIDADNVFYAYDIESTKDVYEALENGSMRIWKLNEYTVSKCSTWYQRK